MASLLAAGENPKRKRQEPWCLLGIQRPANALGTSSHRLDRKLQSPLREGLPGLCKRGDPRTSHQGSNYARTQSSRISFNDTKEIRPRVATDTQPDVANDNAPGDRPRMVLACSGKVA